MCEGYQTETCYRGMQFGTFDIDIMIMVGDSMLGSWAGGVCERRERVVSVLWGL